MLSVGCQEEHSDLQANDPASAKSLRVDLWESRIIQW